MEKAWEKEQKETKKRKEKATKEEAARKKKAEKEEKERRKREAKKTDRGKKNTEHVCGGSTESQSMVEEAGYEKTDLLAEVQEASSALAGVGEAGNREEEAEGNIQQVVAEPEALNMPGETLDKEAGTRKSEEEKEAAGPGEEDEEGGTTTVPKVPLLGLAEVITLVTLTLTWPSKAVCLPLRHSRKII